MHSSLLLFVVAVSAFAAKVVALDNGLSRTPPMGFMTWERFRCQTDCKTYPDTCIGERLIREQAESLVQDGYLDAGYDHIIIDDCWMNQSRDPATGRLRPDEERFPSGIKALADYVHSLGLRFGIYADWGLHTCGGYPGTMNHEHLDAITFAEWGVDYVKLDGCWSDTDKQPQGYKLFEREMNATGRPIEFSCSYPAYDNARVDYDLLSMTCSGWRFTADISNSFGSIVGILGEASPAYIQEAMKKYAGPGHWFDLDQLIIGNGALSVHESEAQLSIWSVLASPLLISADLRSMPNDMKDIYLNKEVLAVSQDPLGHSGWQVQPLRHWSKGMQAFTRPLSASRQALVILNTDSYTKSMKVDLDEIDFSASSANVRDLWIHKDIGVFYHSIAVNVPSNGVAMLVLSSSDEADAVSA